MDYIELMDYLAKKYGVEDNPKLGYCFRLAWHYGHSSGNLDVERHFIDLVELIR